MPNITAEQAAPPRAPTRDWMTANDAAAIAEVTLPTMLRWCLTGRIPARKVVGRWRIKTTSTVCSKATPDPQPPGP